MTHPTRPAPPGGFCIAAYLMPSPMRGRWHGEAVTDEVEALASTRRSPPHQSPPATASPHRGSHWRVHLQSLPFQGRWLGEAETERSPQICSNLSVTFGDSSPGRGAFPREKVKSIWISTAPSIDSSCSEATSIKFDTPVSGGAYQDVHRVSFEWNARPKHRDLPEFRGRTHQP